MKTIIVSFITVLFFVTMVQAQTIPLNSTETVAVPTVSKVQVKKVDIDINGKSIEMIYRFLDANNNPIPMMDSMSSDRKWRCFDRPAELVANCTALGQPYECCTGVGTGTNCFAGDLCWTNTYNDDIKAGEVDNKVGKRLFKRIWDAFKVKVLTAGNDGSLP